MKDTRVKEIRNRLIQRYNSYFGDSVKRYPCDSFLDTVFNRIPGRYIWKAPREEINIAFAYTLCSYCYTKCILVEHIKDKIQLLLKDHSDYPIGELQYIESILAGPIPSEDLLLILLILRDFFSGNEEALRYLLGIILTDADRAMAIEAAYQSYEETAFQSVCFGGNAIQNIRAKLANSSALLENLKTLPIEFIAGNIDSCNKSHHIPITEGVNPGASSNQKDVSECLCMIPPEFIMMGCLLLYLDRQEVAFTSFMLTLLEYAAVHLPNPDWYKMVYMADFPRNMLPDDSTEIDLCKDCIHLPVYVLDEMPENPMIVTHFDCEQEQICMTPAAIISMLAHAPVYGNIFYSKKLEDWFIKHGIDRPAAHDYAVITGALFYNGRLTHKSSIEQSQRRNEAAPEAKKMEELQNENRQLAETNQELLRKLNRCEKDLRVANHALREKKGNPELEEQNKRLTQQVQELTDALEALTAVVEEEPAEPEKEVQFPYFFTKRVVLFGGHDAFRANLQKLLPDIRVMQFTDGVMDVSPIRNADLLCLQPNKCNHPQYWAAVSAAKTNNVPMVHLRYANAELCAKSIVEYLESMEK